MLDIFEEKTINDAISIIESKAAKNAILVDSSQVSGQFCQLKIGMEEREHFAVLFLDSQNRLIEFETMFKGDLNVASVYPRQVAKRALLLNSCNLIITHNHPSNDLTPSNSDKAITNKLSQCLNLFDIQILDHIIVSRKGFYSFAQSGLI